MSANSEDDSEPGRSSLETASEPGQSSAEESEKVTKGPSKKGHKPATVPRTAASNKSSSRPYTRASVDSAKLSCFSPKMAAVVRQKAEFRSGNPNDPNSSHWQQHLQLLQSRIKSVKPQIDTTPPPKPPHRRSTSFRKRINEYSRIDRDNTIMLQHLAEIIHGKGSVDNKQCGSVKKPCTNYKAQQREADLLKITMDNLSLLKRLQNQKSEYSRKVQLVDFRKKEEVMQALSSYPLHWQLDKECKFGPMEVRAREFAAKNPYPRVFMTLGNHDKVYGSVVFELFAKDCPITAENFRGLCTGEYGVSYKCTTIHRVVPNLLWQGGDLAAVSGLSKASIYGGLFKDENFKHKHDEPGKLSMANIGPDTNGCQFMVTARKLPVLDKTNVVFGKVISGLGVLRALFKVTTQSGKPKKKIFILNCGELGEGEEVPQAEVAKYDPYDDFEDPEDE